MTPMVEHLRAGIQYAIDDLKADDSPSLSHLKVLEMWPAKPAAAMVYIATLLLLATARLASRK